MGTGIYNIVICVNILLAINTVLTLSTNDWRLYNESLTAEGTLQIKINGKWFNTCEGNFTTFYKSEICKNIKDNMDQTIETDVRTDTVSITECDLGLNVLECKSDNVSYQPCEHARICCRTPEQAIEVGQGCSGNWKYVQSQTFHATFWNLSINTLNNITFLKDSFFGKFWTSSAFKEVSPSINKSLPDDDDVRNCANSCLQEIRDLGQLTVEIGSCKCGKVSYFANNSRTLEVTNDVNANVKLCVSAEVNGTRLSLEAEDCNSIYRDYRLKKDKYPITIPSTTLSGTLTPEVSTTSDSDTVPENPLLNWITVFVSIVSVVLGIIVIVVGCVVYRIRRLKCGPRNSVSNKTYSHSMTIHRLDSGDEYANILDCEVGLELSSCSNRPPLPSKRIDGDVSVDKSNSDVIALGQYSTPHDTLRSDLQDEYSITYDDPIRMSKLPTSDEKTSENQNEKNEHKFSSSDSNEMGKETMNPESEPHSSHCPLSSSELKYHANAEVLHNDVENDFKQSSSLSSERLSEYEIVVMSSDNGTIERKPEEDDNNSDRSEYEICSIANEKDLTRARILTEHVCLDCLTPEHLKAFGVRIIPDDDYHWHCNDFARRFSAPCNATQSSENMEHNGKTDDLTVSNDEDVTKMNIKKTMCPEVKETSKRKCSVCRSVYDVIGKYNRHDWIRYTDNVYEKFGNFCHSRPHTGGKRMNST